MLTETTCSACNQACTYETDHGATQLTCPNCQSIINVQTTANPFTVPVATVVQQPPPGFPAPGQTVQHDPALKYVIPVDVTGLSIAAGYLGLFAMTCAVAPIAIVVSWLAIRQIKKSDGKLHGLGRARFGLVMGVIFTLLPFGFVVFSMISDAM